MSASILLTTSPARPSLARRLFTALAENSRRVARVWAARRDVRYLATLDDRALKDIGLSRSDVDGALAQPLSHDPSALLVVRACERRAFARDCARAGLRRLDVRGETDRASAPTASARTQRPAIYY